MLSGVGMGDAAMKKVQLIKRLTNQGYNLQVMAVNGLKEYLASERAREEAERLEFERQQREKERILKRIMDSNVRMMGVGFRQAYQWMEHDREKERVLMLKQRGIMRRIVDKNARMVSAGYNKLIEKWKSRQNTLKEKLKFVIKALTDKDANFILMAYNTLKQRKLMLEGVGLGEDNAQKLKIRLIRKLTDTGFNLQTQAANSLKEFLASERAREEAERLEFERHQREKDRILRRIMDSNVRMMGTGFRQSLHFTRNEIDKERQLALKQRGIIRKITDSTYRLLGQYLNQLKHHSNWKNILLKKTVLKLTDSAYRDQAAAFRIFLHNHREAIRESERIERITRGVCNRFRDSAYI